jgi:putative ABC transport system permease protein
LGLISREEVDEIFAAAMDGTSVDNTQKKWTYEEILDTKFRVVLTPDCFVKDETTGLYMDLRQTDAGLRYLYDNGIDLKVSGILCLKEDAGNGMLKGSIGYTVALTEYLIENAQDSAAIRAQLENPEKDIFTGKPFRENTGNLTAEEKKNQFIHYVQSLSDEMKAETYLQILSVPDPEMLKTQIDGMLSQVTREDMELVMVQAMCQQMGISESEAQGYASAMSDEELQQLYAEMAAMQIRARQEAAVRRQMGGIPADQLAAMLQGAMET